MGYFGKQLNIVQTFTKRKKKIVFFLISYQDALVFGFSLDFGSGDGLDVLAFLFL